MELKPLDSPELIELVARWLSRKENCQWLDFGDGRRLTPQWLKIMTQRDTRVLRVYTTDEGTAAGVVGLEDVSRTFRTARLWAVTGDDAARARGYATLACSKLLTVGFRELGLHAVNTWIVEHNPSMRVAERLGFKMIGRQRQCHWIDGRVYDRIWLDLLASEHREIQERSAVARVS